MKSKKTIQKKPAKKDVDAKPDAPETPETSLVEVNGGKTVRVFDIGAVFGVERSDGTIDLIAKDRVSNAFRRSGYNVAYSPQGFDHPPADSAAYVTIEEVEDLCSEVTDGQRESAQAALKEDEARPEAPAPSSHVGTLDPPAPREETK